MVVDTLVNLSVGTTSTIGYQTALDIVRIDEPPRLRRDTRPAPISGPVLEGWPLPYPAIPDAAGRLIGRLIRTVAFRAFGALHRVAVAGIRSWAAKSLISCRERLPILTNQPGDGKPVPRMIGEKPHHLTAHRKAPVVGVDLEAINASPAPRDRPKRR
jgi:hypothetical protein